MYIYIHTHIYIHTQVYILYIHVYLHPGFLGGASCKECSRPCKRHKRYGFDPWVRMIPWRRAWQPTPVSLPGESHGQRSLVGYSPQGCKESDMTEVTQHIQFVSTHIHTTYIYTHIFTSTFVYMWVCMSHFCPVRILEQRNPNRNEHLLMLKSWLLKTILHLKKSGIHGETTDFSTGTGENTSWGSCSARKQGSAEGMMETWLKDTRASLSRCPLAKDGTIQASKQ